MTAPTDPRPHFLTATTWVTELMTGISPEQLDSPSPCTEFDVHSLMGHLIGVARRVRAAGAGEDIFAVEMTVTDPTVEEYTTTVAEAIENWSDDATLSRLVRVPWGEVPGAGALWGWTNENLVHGWDLAVATGQPAEADPTTAEVTLGVARQFIPAAIRNDDTVPFAAVVDARPDAGPTERLANWSGRESIPWLARN